MSATIPASGDVLDAPDAPDAVLGAALELHAQLYLDARRRVGQGLLDAANAVHSARQQARHGQWGPWLRRVGLSDDGAERLLAIHAQAEAHPLFAEQVRQGFLGLSVAGEVARSESPDALLARLMQYELPPTVAQTRAERREIAPPNSATSRNLPPPAPAPAPLTCTACGLTPAPQLYTNRCPGCYMLHQAQQWAPGSEDARWRLSEARKEAERDPDAARRLRRLDAVARAASEWGFDGDLVPALRADAPPPAADDALVCDRCGQPGPTVRRRGVGVKASCLRCMVLSGSVVTEGLSDAAVAAGYGYKYDSGAFKITRHLVHAGWAYADPATEQGRDYVEARREQAIAEIERRVAPAPIAPESAPNPADAPPNPAPADAFDALAAAMQAAGLSLAWDGERFVVYEGGKGHDAVYSSYPAADWDNCRRRCEHLLTPAPAPVAADDDESEDAPDDLDMVQVDDECGPTVMIRAVGLAPVVADAIAQVADALRLIALGEAHAVDTPLLDQLADALDGKDGAGPAIAGACRLVAEAAEEALAAAPDPTDPAAALAAEIAKAERRPMVERVRRAEQASLQRRLDALADDLDDATYERLAHRIGALTPPQQEAA
jgi:hypothetical protein